jgi:uncharacterized protein
MRCGVFALMLSVCGGIGCATAPPQGPTCPTAPAALAASGATAPPDPPAEDLASFTNEQLATRLLGLTGATQLGKQVMDGMTDNFAKLPGLPPGFLDKFRENVHPEELTELLVPIYVKNFDRDTLMAAIRFYESKYGRTMVAAMPAATKASMEVGQSWGKKLAIKTLSDMGMQPPKSP